MSDPLPGTHLCIDHQGNHSHYAKENCEICRGREAIRLLQEIEVAAALIDGKEYTNYALTERVRAFRARVGVPRVLPAKPPSSPMDLYVNAPETTSSNRECFLDGLPKD